MRKYILIFFILTIFISCNSHHKYSDKYTLSASGRDSIVIRLSPFSKNLSHHIQYFQSNQIGYLALLNMMNNSIEFYDLNMRKLVKELKIPKEGSNSFGALHSYFINNFDTLIMLSLVPQKLALMDTSGNILKTIPYNKDINNRTTQISRPLGGGRPFKSGNNIYLSQTYKALESNGILTKAGQMNSFLNLVVDLNSGVCNFLPLTYPEQLTGQDVSTMRTIRTMGHGNCFVYQFSNISDLFITYDNVEFERRPVETNYQLILQKSTNIFTDIETGLRQKLNFDDFINLYYDDYRECYYALIRKRSDDNVKSKSLSGKFLYPECYILILDKDLRHLGEVHFPPDKYSFQMFFITPEGVYISEDHINNPSFSEDYMRFRLFTLEKI